MSAPIDTLLSRLQGVRKARKNSWMARCPAHNGDGSSMAITHVEDGRILIHCFAHKCEAGDILAAIGMSVGDLFPEPLPQRERPYERRKHGISSLDVLRAMRHELLVVHFIADEITRGEIQPGLCERAQLASARIRTALELCDG